MKPQDFEHSTDDVLRNLPGFDAEERNWIRENAVEYLRTHPSAGHADVLDVVLEWAALLTARERPVLEDALEEATDAALELHPGLGREVEVFCRHMVRRWVADGNPGFNTVGEVFDFILNAETAVGAAQLTRFRELTETTAGRVGSALASRGIPKMTAEERSWLRQEILADFGTSEFSPFQNPPGIPERHLRLLVDRLRLRPAKWPLCGPSSEVRWIRLEFAASGDVCLRHRSGRNESG